MCAPVRPLLDSQSSIIPGRRAQLMVADYKDADVCTEFVSICSMPPCAQTARACMQWISPVDPANRACCACL